MGKMTGASFHEPSAFDARARIIGFFGQHLKAEPARVSKQRNP
jgi:hypothetical protein